MYTEKFEIVDELTHRRISAQIKEDYTKGFPIYQLFIGGKLVANCDTLREAKEEALDICTECVLEALYEQYEDFKMHLYRHIETGYDAPTKCVHKEVLEKIDLNQRAQEREKIVANIRALFDL